MKTDQTTSHSPRAPYTFQKNGLLLYVHIQPNAKHEGVIGLYQNSVKIAVKAPASENKANLQLIAFLAALFDVPPSQIIIKRGLKSREKTVYIS